MSKPICITFAGTPGSHKSPVAAYLSHELKLPVFEHDAIRDELQADTGVREDDDEYYRRRDERRKAILERGDSFIYDASQDRAWPTLKKMLEDYGYRWFLINMNLSRPKLAELQANQKRLLPEDTDRWFKEHQEFNERDSADVGLEINDANFEQRNELALQAVRDSLGV